MRRDLGRCFGGFLVGWSIWGLLRPNLYPRFIDVIILVIGIVLIYLG